MSAGHCGKGASNSSCDGRCRERCYVCWLALHGECVRRKGSEVAAAFCSAIMFNTRWDMVIFGDLLYAPFRIRAKRPDVTQPEITRLTLLPLRSPAGGRRVLV